MSIFWILPLIFSIVSGAGVWYQNPSTNRLYYISDPDQTTIGSARSQCQSMGAYLVEVNNVAEHTYITSLLTNNHYWVGMERINGVWVWSNAGNAPGAWMPWGATAASDDTGVRYALYSGNYELDGRRSAANYYYICELEMGEACTASNIYETVEIPVTQTVENMVPHTVENTVFYTVEKTIMNTVENAVTYTVANTITATASVGQCAAATVTVENTVFHTVEKTIMNTVENAVTYTVENTITATPSVGQCVGATVTAAYNNDDIQSMVNDMTVDVKTTNSYQRTLISADDPRPSAKMVGLFGLSFIVIVFGILIFLDLARAITFLKQCCRKDSEDDDSLIDD